MRIHPQLKIKIGTKLQSFMCNYIIAGDNISDDKMWELKIIGSKYSHFIEKELLEELLRGKDKDNRWKIIYEN